MKDGFMLYCSHYPTIKKLSNEDKGKLLDAVFQYNINGVDPEFDSFPVELSFSFLKQQFDRDQEKYQNVVDRNKKNIIKRWDKKDTKNTSGIIGIKKDTKNTDKDNVNDNVNDNDKDKGKENKRLRFTPPSLNEISIYISENKFNIDPQRFLDFYTANGWVQGKGKPIKDWKATVRTWNSREKTEKTTYRHPATDIFNQDIKEQINKF